jgi:hypothetical protein
MPRFAAWLLASIPAVTFKRNARVGIRPAFVRVEGFETLVLDQLL